MTWGDCNILLNSMSNGEFYTGDIVTGSVALEFRKAQQIKAITFKVLGSSKAGWTRPSPTVPYIRIYSEKEIFFYVNIDVFHQIKGQTVQPGTMYYPFNFSLPTDLPSSFKDSIAKVCYRIVVQNKLSYKMKQKKVFTMKVISTFTIHHIDDNNMPAFFEVTKKIKNPNDFSLILKTYKEFAPNQRIPFEAFITNESKVMITKILVTLIQTLQYTISSGYYIKEKNICMIVHKNITHNASKETCNFNMDIPQVLPTTINLENPTISISYKFKVDVCFRCHLNLSMEVPVVVGTTTVNHREI